MAYRGEQRRSPEKRQRRLSQTTTDVESGRSGSESFSPRVEGQPVSINDPRHPLYNSPGLEKGVRIETVPVKSGKTTPAKPAGAPSLWTIYCLIVTCWCPNAVLSCIGKRKKAEQDAWREKMGLISIILMICAIVGFLTFGFTEVVCPADSAVRLRVNHVTPGYMIFHGKAYDLASSRHPAAIGISQDINVLYDLPTRYGGMDGSFMFQNVNGACKGLIKPATGSGVPTNSRGEMGWYFPCRAFKQDGSSQPDFSIENYYGYACHTSTRARRSFYSMKPAGDVYFTWDDIKNSSRNLMVWGSDVIDLNLLNWLNSSEVTVPTEFTSISKNKKLRGTDVTRTFSSSRDKKIARCLTEIAKVGSVDTETIGCIASQVVLYVSLIFILSIVLAKFVLALLFQWFACRKFNLPKHQTDLNQQAVQSGRTKNIYAAGPGTSNQMLTLDRTKRASFLPRNSRFTDVSAPLEAPLQPVTMTTMTQASSMTDRGSLAMYGHGMGNNSRLGLNDHMRHSVIPSSLNVPGSRVSSYANEPSHSSGVPGGIHRLAVPQPPPSFQPRNFPPAHVICLVTAYSEGEEGLRSTLNSIALTKYPNSHKLILVICDGMIKGQGETMTTPDIALSMMKEESVAREDVQAYSYVAVASGSKRLNMAKVYTGFYDFGSPYDLNGDEKDEDKKDKDYSGPEFLVPMMVIVKCGTDEEALKSKAGNRGKRDSQVILMGFLQKVMFDERMSELEYEIFRSLWRITGIRPEFYEIVLMVDADTKVHNDSLCYMVHAMVQDPMIMGLCGETKISNKSESWVSWIQVFEYFVSHHLSKSFESIFGGVTCLPGCFCMYRIKAPQGDQNCWVPILASPDIVGKYSINVVETLHEKNLLLLGEDRYLSTMMLKTFPKRKQVFVPQATCETMVPNKFAILLSQRRRWINSTVHNLMELVLVRDLCGTFCFSMQFVVFIELVGTLVLPAAISFTIYLITIAIVAGATGGTVPVIPLILLGLILGLPGFLIVLTARELSYIGWMFIYLLSLPVWNFILPSYAYWKFDDFSWGDTRKTEGEGKDDGHGDADGAFDSSKVHLKRRTEWEVDRETKNIGLQFMPGIHKRHLVNMPAPIQSYDSR